MSEAITYRIGFDVAKGVFQVHGVANEPGERVALVRRLRRRQVAAFFATLPRSLIGMEACGSAHYWARLAQQHGHAVRLMPPAYVKAYVKRNKTDAHDAAAICEAVARPHMRFVPVKGEADQALLMLHRMRASFVEKRTAAANQLRAAVLVELARQWRSVAGAVRKMDAEIAAGVKQSARAQRLLAVPAIGPVGASALDALLPNPQVFRSGRDFAAWTGLTPREDSSGQSLRRGPISKQGDGYLRRILVLGATAHLARVRRGQVQGASAWVLKMAAHPKRKLAAVALANKTARIAWAMLARNENYRAPAAALQAA